MTDQRLSIGDREPSSLGAGDPSCSRSCEHHSLSGPDPEERKSGLHFIILAQQTPTAATWVNELQVNFQRHKPPQPSPRIRHVCVPENPSKLLQNQGPLYVANAAEVEEIPWVNVGQMGLSLLSSKSYLERIMNPAAALATKCAQTSRLNSWYLPAKSLVFIPLNVLVLVDVYGTYWQLTLEKNPTLLDLCLLERGKFLLKHLPLVFTEKKSIIFYQIESSESASCWLTSWVHGYNPVSLFLHGPASSESKSF